jgi:nucleoside-diphosphate-sugar epimerase
MKTYPKYAEHARNTKLVDVSADKYYGKGYQDVSARVPLIEKARIHLGWEPKMDMETTLKKILDFHLSV